MSVLKNDKLTRKVCLIIFLLFVFLVIFQLDNRFQVFRIFFRILFRLDDSAAYTTFEDFWSYIAFFLHLDSYIIWTTSFFQIIMIFFLPIAGVLLYQRMNTIIAMEAVKYKSQNRLFFDKAIRYSLVISLAIFTGYLVMFIPACFLCPVENEGILYRTIFTDILGTGFYFNHRQLFYLLEGFTRFFFVPFTYSFFSCSIAFYIKNRYLVYFLPIFYWIGGIAIGYFFYYIIPDYHFYFSPSTIMASGTFNINTFLIFMPHIFIWIISILLVKRAGKKYEI